ncbi:MAG: endolytic transglycosylase MltG, partial [bacterium]
VFAIAARVMGVSGSLQEGEYRLSPAMPLLDIVEILARGEVVLRRVTIPEGFTAAEIVDALVGAGVGTREGLHDLVTRGGSRYAYAFLRGSPAGSLEGFLFPDTYLIPRRLADRDIVDLFLRHFSSVVVPRWRQTAPHRSLRDVVTMASLIEREAKVPAERPLIASVLYNRLARGMRLEVDATVLYALGGHKKVVTYDDLKVDSPYNTYRYAGLPPGPITNPGLAAIMAALKPAQTAYLFYVARADGSHVFSRTFSEHLIAIRKYRGR